LQLLLVVLLLLQALMVPLRTHLCLCCWLRLNC
jgi:hypothetical protein